MDIKQQECVQVAFVCMTFQHIIPLNAVSYGVEHLAAVLCFSVENQPKPLLWSQSMNEWIRYETKSHK